MSVPSWMWHLPIWPDTRNATSLQASVDGLSQPDLLDGQTPESCGPGVAPVSLSAPRAEGASKGGETLGTYGRIGATSSGLDDLLPSLASRLPVPSLGPLRSEMIWRPMDIGSGLPLSRHARSGLTTFGKESGFLHTPTCAQNMSAPSMQKHKCCRGVIVSPEEFCRRMGYPPEWISAAPAKASETPSSRNSRRK